MCELCVCVFVCEQHQSGGTLIRVCAHAMALLRGTGVTFHTQRTCDSYLGLARTIYLVISLPNLLHYWQIYTYMVLADSTLT